MINKLKILFVLIILIACKEIQYIEKVKIDTIKVASPVIEDTIKAKIITDTVIVADKINKKDTAIIVKYFPVAKKFYVKAKPDTVTILKIDTVKTQLINKNNEVTNILILVIILSIIIVAIKWSR
ncbi:hypothetical protein [Rosettibacter firmus]|uniref:hypothetical protein n=1 Tax=Rosettibacter firmus TaxID=3111522 RepID=UPI00336BD11A